MVYRLLRLNTYSLQGYYYGYTYDKDIKSIFLKYIMIDLISFT